MNRLTALKTVLAAAAGVPVAAAAEPTEPETTNREPSQAEIDRLEERIANRPPTIRDGKIVANHPQQEALFLAALALMLEIERMNDVPDADLARYEDEDRDAFFNAMDGLTYNLTVGIAHMEGALRLFKGDNHRRRKALEKQLRHPV